MAETFIGTEEILDLSITTQDISASAVTPDRTALSASWDFAEGTLLYKTPILDNEVAIKSYVDAATQGVRDPKDAVLVTTGTTLTLTGLQTLDDIALSQDDRVLVRAQTNAALNGIYLASTGSWPRSSDADEDAEVTNGLYTLVATGTLFGGNGYLLTTGDPITVGTTDLNFIQFTGLGQVVAGDGLTKDGNTIDVVGDSSIFVAADYIAIASGGVNTWHVATGAITQEQLATGSVGPAALQETGVTPDTYTFATITVDADGRITAASNGSGGSGGGSFTVATQNDGGINEIFTSSSVSFVGSDGSGNVASDQGTDVFFYVSGTIGSLGTANSGSALFGGDLKASGSIVAEQGFTGSITQLLDGTPFIQGGDLIDVTTGSSGEIIISSADGAPTGTLSEGNHVYGALLTGTIDGTNTEYTLAPVPQPIRTLRLYVNGLRMRSGSTEDYLVADLGTALAVTFSRGPRTNSNLLADFIQASG